MYLYNNSQMYNCIELSTIRQNSYGYSYIKLFLMFTSLEQYRTKEGRIQNCP